MAQGDRKNKQYIALGLLGATALGGFVLLGLSMNGGGNAGLPSRQAQTVDETIIADRTSAASPEMSWITEGRIRMESQQQELEELRKLFDQARRDADKREAALREEYDDQMLQQAQKITSLETELEQARSQPFDGGKEQVLNAAAQAGGRQLLQQRVNPAEGPGSDFVSRRQPDRTRRQSGADPQGELPGARSGFGQSFTLASVEEPETEERDIRRLGEYLPAGSYAPAVVLSGADASTNVSNRDNPIPVLFRITGPAVAAALGKRKAARINLTGCTVQGSATGDLSSERVKVRLISMTCVNGRGEVLETKVAGYMAGSGKEGVRGHVVSREGANVRNAAIAGALGGLGSGLSAAATSSLNQEEASVSQILQSAGAGTLAGGAEQAANTLADYYIKRAEQYQPVISLYGGTKVELVFLQGVELGQ